MLAFDVEEALLLSGALFLHVCVFAALMCPFATDRRQAQSRPRLTPDCCAPGACVPSRTRTEISTIRALNGDSRDAAGDGECDGERTTERELREGREERNRRVLVFEAPETSVTQGVALTETAASDCAVDAHAHSKPLDIKAEADADAGIVVGAVIRPLVTSARANDARAERPPAQAPAQDAAPSDVKAAPNDAKTQAKDNHWIRTSLRLYRLLLSNPPFLSFSFSVNLCVGANMM